MTSSRIVAGAPDLRPGRSFLVLAAANLAALVAFSRLVILPAVEHVPAGALRADPALRDGIPLLVAAAQAVILLAVTPSLARSGRAPDPRAWVRLGILGVVGAVGLAIADPSRLRLPGADAGILLAFGAVLLGLRDVLMGAGAATARLAPVVLGALLLTTLTWSGPLIEALDSPSSGVDAAVRANPLACIAGGVHGLDWARFRPITYDQFVGQYYPFTYPRPLPALGGWGLAGALLGLAGWALGRWRARRAEVRETPPVE